MNRLSKRLTFVIIPDANQSVQRYRIPGLLLVFVPAFVIMLAICSALFIYLFSGRSAEVHNLQQQITSLENVYKDQLIAKDEQIGVLQTDLLALSEQAHSIESKMAEITELELQLKEIAGIETPQVRISSGIVMEEGGQGGEEIVLPQFSDNMLAQDTMQSFANLSKLIEELKPSLEETRQAVLQHQHLMNITPSIWPADSRKITSEFGIRRDPFTGRRTIHNGLDLGGNRGDPIYAAADGVVVTSERSYPEGNYITIDHGRGIKTRYLHLNQRIAEVGDKVKKGDIIGELGNTGRSTGPHLHYEVIVNGTHVNPMPYIKEDRKEN